MTTIAAAAQQVTLPCPDCGQPVTREATPKRIDTGWVLAWIGWLDPRDAHTCPGSEDNQ